MLKVFCVMKASIGQIYFFRMHEGDDLLDTIKKCAEQSGVKAGFFILIGALKNAVVGFYKDKQYKFLSFDKPLEIASCVGNIAVNENGEVMIHAHIVVTDEAGQAFGGHLMKGSIVSATAELVIVEGLGAHLVRALDSKTNLNLLKLG
jgi:hypothetical protein